MVRGLTDTGARLTQIPSRVSERGELWRLAPLSSSISLEAKHDGLPGSD
jgi:hypothetical protein